MAAFNEINLQVGAKLQMTMKSGSEQGVYYTELIGYVEDDYLIIKIPVENGASIQVCEGQSLSFRIFSGVNIFTFSCTVKSIFTAPGYMHISFPVDVKATILRNAIRAKVGLPVQINGPFKPATMTDVSVSGAGMTSDEILGEPGEDLLIYFLCPISLTNQEIPIKTTVKICSVQRLPGKQENTPPKWVYGLMFYEISPTNKVILQNFVYESLNRKA